MERSSTLCSPTETSTLNLLRGTFNGCSSNAKKTAYLVLVRPHLEYAGPVWYLHTQKATETLERVQKKAAHWICSKWDKINHCWSKSYDQDLSELQWPTIRQRHNFLSICQIYKCLNNLDCIEFDSYFRLSHRPSCFHSFIPSCVSSRVDCFRYSFILSCLCSLPVEYTAPQIVRKC